jgi:hypothetical protein
MHVLEKSEIAVRSGNTNLAWSRERAKFPGIGSKP